MNQDLRNRLAAVVEALDPEFRGIGERDSMLLLDAGAVSALDLFGLIKDRSKAAEVRASACWFAGRLRLADATSAIIGALEDEYLDLREAAAEALGQLASPAAVQPLLRAMHDTTDLAVRIASVYALGMIGDQRAVDPLISLLGDTNEHPHARGMAAEKLGEFGDGRALEPLRAALKDPSAEVRFWAAFALGDLGNPRALGDLGHLAATDRSKLPGWGIVGEEAEAAIESIRQRQSAAPDPT